MRTRTVPLMAMALFVMLWAGLTSAWAAPVELTFWHGYNDTEPEGKAFAQIVKLFNETHPNIKVTAQVHPQGGTFFEGYQVAVLGDAGPDVMWFERSIVANWARTGLLQPLGKVGSTATIKAGNFLPGAFSEVVYENQIYGVPWNTDVRGLYWNADMLNNAGFNGNSGPTTWEALNDWSLKLTRRDGEKLTQVGLVPWSGNWFLPAWVWTFGGELYDAVNRKATFTAPKVVEALEWLVSYANYAEPAEVNELAAGGNLFTLGKMAFLTEGNWSVNWIGSSPVNYGMGPVPHPQGGRNGTWGGGFAITVPKGSRHPTEAAEFAQWLGTTEPQLIFARVVSTLPTNLPAVSRFISDQPAKMRSFFLQANEANPRYQFVWMDVLIAAVTQAQEKALNGGVAPRIALEETQASLQAKINDFFNKK